MINTRVIQGIVPPGGWHFIVPDKKTRIAAPDFPRLVQMVAEYRVNNMLPLGDPLGDCEEFICGQWPHMCHSAKGNASVSVEIIALPKPQAGVVTIVDRVIAWLERMTEGVSMDNIVLEPEARRRADLCISCPRNVRWKTSCSNCNDNIERLSAIVRMGRRLLKNPKLKACSVLGQELKAAVWLRRERVLSDDQALPDYCWCRRGGSQS